MRIFLRKKFLKNTLKSEFVSISVKLPYNLKAYQR